MNCTGLQAFNPACQAAAAAASAAESAFATTANFFARAAVSATRWLWAQIDSATAVDLGSAALVREMQVTGAMPVFSVSACLPSSSSSPQSDASPVLCPAQ